ncbi:MAG: cysteine--tRNA ligase [Desulfofustis sp.]|jgi:cysteinyl-tRNA synthetase|nr:cysteine--tRNA ligase [Desulfofustis sp.]
MSVRIYNTLTQKKEPLNPLEPGHVKLYVCGITSYDYCHIGHARSSLVFDMIVKYLRYCGYKVTFVRNFTDIDDKIINRANEQGTPPAQLAARFIDEFYRDMDYLGLQRPDIEPKATEHIDDMIGLIETLIAKGQAYAVDGDVYFAVEQFPAYGKLSRRRLEDMQAGARITINEKKHNPMDFALWKHSKAGEPAWDSPWGPGRPGWHIECSAMSKKYLGDTFDIHGGGKDLIFPHHENEIAQSEAANDKPFVNMWVHHGFVTVRNEATEENEKMSKSLGNFLTIRELSEKYHPEILKLFIFSTQYRNPLEYSEQAMLDAETGLTRLYESIAGIDSIKRKPADIAGTVITDKEAGKIDSLEERFRQAMDNDFNTAQAIGQLFDAAKTVNKILRKLPVEQAPVDLARLDQAREAIIRQGRVIGILNEPADVFLERRKRETIRDAVIDPAAIETLIARRNEARKNKDWKLSDAIRDELLAKSVELKDGPDGTTWSVKRD